MLYRISPEDSEELLGVASMVLGPPQELRRVAKAISTLDLILSPEWEFRYFSYNSRWSQREELASMRDGSGDSWYMLFLPNDWCAVKGFVRASPSARSKNLATSISRVIPHEFEAFSIEPAFDWEYTSFCYWYDPRKRIWSNALLNAGYPPDLETGAEDMLRILTGDPEVYREFAAEYFEREIPRPAIEFVYDGQPLDQTAVKRIRADSNLDSIIDELEEIGYPYCRRDRKA